MSNVAIMADSVACIPRDLAQQYNITVVPAAHISVNGNEFIDGVTLNATEAYELIKKDPDRFVTSAIAPDYILKVFEELSQSADTILFITIASALSAVCRTAALAADLLHEKQPDVRIRIVDSRACGSTEGMVVLAAAKAAAQGKGLDETAVIAEKARDKTGGIMMLDTLRYVYRTGRMSKTASRIASAFNIKPINRLTDNGTIELIDRSRKVEDGIKRLVNAVAEQAGTDSLHFMITHAAAPENADNLAGELKKRFNCLSMLVSDYSPVMGYGAGPGALFVGFHPELD